MSPCILNEVGGTVSERGCISVVVQEDGETGASRYCCAVLLLVRARSPALFRSFDLVRMTHDTTATADSARH